MTQYILDTDHLSLLRQGHPQVLQRVAALAPSQIAVTIISVEEQLRGWLSVVRKHIGTPRQIWAYNGLSAAVLFNQTATILPFDEAAYQQFEELRQQKVRVGAQDLRIAAIVLTTNRILVTRNHRDFAQVPGISLEDWTVAD